MEKQKFHILLVDLGANRSELNEPIGIGCLSSYVKVNLGERVEIRQRFVHLTGIPSQREFAWADIVGLSTPLGSLERIRTCVKHIRNIPKEEQPLVLLGGLIATFASDNLLAMIPEAICVVGEGEEPLLRITENYMQSCDQKDTCLGINLANEAPNLVFFYEGKLRRSPRRLLNLETVPPPDRAFVKDIARLGGTVRAEASRGCAWGLCSFCAIQFKYCNIVSWRPFSVERIVNELVQLSSLGIRSPYYTDEDFVGKDPKRAIRLAQAICRARDEERLSNVNFYLDARVDSVLARGKNGGPSGIQVFKALKEAGLREVFLGIESGARDQVKRYRKSSTVERNLEAVLALYELGLTLDIGFIMFDPEMTLAELAANVTFIERAGLKTHDARLTKCLRVEPGTLMAEEYVTKGLIIGPLNVDDLTYPYRWLDAQVESVYHDFSAYEAPFTDINYQIQAKTRGEVSDENTRRKWKQCLGELRAVDLDVLALLVRQVQDGKDALKVSLDPYLEKREKILSENKLVA